jgi:hypothetical protein
MGFPYVFVPRTGAERITCANATFAERILIARNESNRLASMGSERDQKAIGTIGYTVPIASETELGIAKAIAMPIPDSRYV